MEESDAKRLTDEVVEYIREVYNSQNILVPSTIHYGVFLLIRKFEAKEEQI